MFYSHEILSSQQYGVATIWTIANTGPRGGLRKIARKEIEKVNLRGACGKIIAPGPPISLRLQSGLFYGVTRVFSHQCTYMLNDAEKVWDMMKTFYGINPNPNNETDLKAGKARREQIILGDDPGFVPSAMIPQFVFDDGSSLLPLSSQCSSSGKKSQSQLSPFPDPVSIINLDFSQSSSHGDFQLPSPLGRTPAKDTFLPQMRDVGFNMNADQIVLDDLDDFAGAIMMVDDDGALIDDDLELPILPGLDFPEADLEVQQQDPMQEGELPQKQGLSNQDRELDFGVFDADIPVFGSDPFLPPPPPPDDAVQPPRTPEQIQSDEISAPVKKRRRALKLDGESTTISRSVLKIWQEEYVGNADRIKKKRKRVAPGQAKDTAYWLVLGRGIWNIGDSRGITGVTYPLAEHFAGSGLRDRVFGPPSEDDQQPDASTPRKRRREPQEEVDDEGGKRNVRPKVEATPQHGRSMDDVPDLGPMLGDEIVPEVGMADQPVADRMSPSVMPWNQTPSVGRGSSIAGHSAQKGRQGSTSLRGSSLPPLPDPPSSDRGGAQVNLPDPVSDGLDPVDISIDAQENKNDSQWAQSSEGVANDNFLRWAGDEAIKTGSIKEGDTQANRLWVNFDDLVPVAKNHAVAANAFYNVLALATKSIVAVEQDGIDIMRAFGAIRIGVDMTAHLNYENRE